MVQLSTPWGDPNRGMDPPWGAFCQITLTSCYIIHLVEVCVCVCLHYNLNLLQMSAFCLAVTLIGENLRRLHMSGSHVKVNRQGHFWMVQGHSVRLRALLSWVVVIPSLALVSRPVILASKVQALAWELNWYFLALTLKLKQGNKSIIVIIIIN